MIERIKHTIVAEGYTKKEAKEKAIAEARELAEELEGELAENPTRGADVELTAPVAPKAEVEKLDTPKFKSNYYLKNEDGRIDGNYEKLSAATNKAKELAIENNENITVCIEKITTDNSIATVTANEASLGKWGFIFTESRSAEAELDADDEDDEEDYEDSEEDEADDLEEAEVEDKEEATV